MNPSPELITSACFPTPQILVRSSDGTVPTDISGFSTLQARQAQTLYRILTSRPRHAADVRRRTAVVTSAFVAAEQWRYRVAATQPRDDGRYSAVHIQRFRTRITDKNVNYFPIGEPDRYREGSLWDEATDTYVGGRETPASRTMHYFAALARSRFAETVDDIVVNTTLLADGRTVPGTRLLRRAAAAEASAALAARIAARGGDTSRVRATPGLIYTASATTAQRRAIFQAAMTLVADLHPSDSRAIQAWLDATYLLYQAPRRKRGSDATIRTFLVAAGLYLLGWPPVLPHDLDLLAYVHTQRDFTRVVSPLILTLP
ncbi:MAG TPA: hypothetical protein VFC19_32605 [Candidatus Limnocylindrales bacterium]|nr:hypothetical protein [Candidatus Limnocylindrales bacterium]